jgi:hypothetical protein
MQPKLNPITFVKHVGPALTLRTIAEQGWYTKLFLGLRADLGNLPDVRPAKVPIRMEPRDPTSFDAFERELREVDGNEYLEVLYRVWSCEAGVQNLYVAEVDGQPAYAQWLVRPDDQHLMEAHMPGRYRALAGDEVLLEGAYTFAAFRRMGMMADGMAQLLRIARHGGATAAITYVGADNLPSLRGCANVGFRLDHNRYSERRLKRRRTLFRAADGQAEAIWAAATAPRS